MPEAPAISGGREQTVEKGYTAPSQGRLESASGNRNIQGAVMSAVALKADINPDLMNVR